MEILPWEKQSETPNGQIISTNEFSNQFLTRLKTDVVGKYILTIKNLGNNPVSVGILFGNLPFVGQNNQFNVNLFSGIVVGGILIIFGIIVLITGLIVVILDRRRGTRTKPTTTTWNNLSGSYENWEIFCFVNTLANIYFLQWLHSQCFSIVCTSISRWLARNVKIFCSFATHAKSHIHSS